MEEPEPQTAEEYAARSLRRRQEREQREADTFNREMERQTRLFSPSTPYKIPDELPKPLSIEEIQKLTPSERAIYEAAMRERKRRAQLRRRENAANKPGKSGGYHPGVL